MPTSGNFCAGAAPRAEIAYQTICRELHPPNRAQPLIPIGVPAHPPNPVVSKIMCRDAIKSKAGLAELSESLIILARHSCQQCAIVALGTCCIEPPEGKWVFIGRLIAKQEKLVVMRGYVCSKAADGFLSFL